MSEIAQEVVNTAEEKPKFNVDGFAKTPNSKVESVKPVVPTTPVVEPIIEDEDEVVFEETPITEAVIEVPKKNVMESLRSIDADITDEDDVVTRYSTLKEENNKLKIVSKGRSIIDKDEAILGWKKALKMSDKEKAEMSMFLEYKNSGYDEEKARAKAEKIVTEWEETDLDKIEDNAVRLSHWLNQNIEGKTKFIEDEIVKNTVSFDVENDVLSKAKNTILDTKEFLGMNLPKDDVKREKILKDAGEFANTDEFKKMMKDPKVVGKIALFLKYEGQWEKNIKQRGTSKTAIIDKLATAPSVQPHQIERSQGTDKPKTGFNPSKFK